MGRVNMVRLTVSGHPGSGTSTLVRGLMDRFGWNCLNGGDVFREEAKRRGMSLRERMQGDHSADIVESRLAGWWAYKLELPILRLWLDVSDEERARRVAEREGLTVEEALLANRQRSNVDGERFKLLYDLLPEDPEPYTHILDATTLNASQILDHAVALLEEAQ